MIRSYVVDAPNAAESVDHRPCDPDEALRIRMGQDGLHGVAEVDDFPAVSDTPHVGQYPHFLAPGLNEINGGDLPLLSAQ